MSNLQIFLRGLLKEKVKTLNRVQAIKVWLDALRAKSERSNDYSQSTLSLDRILGAESIKSISSGIIGSVYGPLYGCVLFR